MKITVATDVLGKENNGTTIAAMNLIRHLKAKGHEVNVLCADQDKKGQPNYYVVPNWNVGPFNWIVRKNDVTLASPKPEIIMEAIKDSDAIHIMLPFRLGCKTLKMAKELGKPTTAGFHMQAENLTCQFGLEKIKFVNKSVYRFIYNKFYKHIDCIHFPTKFIRDDFEGVIKKKVNGYVISNGVNAYIKRTETKKPKELEDKIVILTTGRYGKEKAQDVLIEAVKYSKYKDKIQLIIAGPGGRIEKKLRKLAEDLPVFPQFKYFKRNEMLEVLNSADLYVHPARVELEGIACLEAICCGKLVIVSNSERSATKNFAVDEKCIFENDNPKDLARVIDFWIENPELKKEYENKYNELSELYDQEKCMDRMEQMIYDSIEINKKNLQEKAERKKN